MNCSNTMYQNMQRNGGARNGMDDVTLAMAYVPWQRFYRTYEPSKALETGTIFPELNKPFTGRGGNYR